MQNFSPIFLLFLVLIQVFPANCCIEHERQALLKFKDSVSDPSDRLASWSGNKCCNWAGIGCSNTTGRVIKLDLQNSYFYFDEYYDYSWNNHSLSGKISPALQILSNLEYLDLSYNNFSANKFPKFISNFKYLNYLNLSLTGLSGIIPHGLGNLSKLQYLDLSYMPDAFVSNVWWLSQLKSLKYLDMSEINFLDSREWTQALNTLPLLQTLYLGANNLTTIPASINGPNFPSLKILSVWDNSFTTRIPDWIGKLTKLTTLQLASCSFVGPIPNQLDNLSLLKTLDLSGNNLEGPMPPLHNLRNLTQLSINDVNIGQDIREVMSKLSNDTLDKLQVLCLSNSSLHGNLTGWVSKLSSLNMLELSYNNLNGTIPTEIGNITSLETLGLGSNFFTGEFSKAHVTGLSNLKELDLGFNNITITVGRQRVPPFQLEELSLSGCKLGPHFPPWLQNQTRMNFIDLSNTGIADIVPNWFWNYSDMYIKFIDLSNNQMTGMLPLSLENLKNLEYLGLSNNSFEGGLPLLPQSILYVILSYNGLSGPLPHHVEAPYLSVLDLSNNLLNGTIEHLTCGLDELIILCLEQNNLSGNLPQCWPSTLRIVNMARNLLNGTIEHLSCGLHDLTILNLAENSFYGNLPHCWPTTLKVVNLANNKLSGTIPNSMGSLIFLEILQLNNNSLTGELPSELQFCHNLIVLDVGENKFSGQIPYWIGESLNNLTILRLRSNMFSGKIPIQLMYLDKLQVLDFASNYISGSIPQSFEHLNAMASSTDENNSSYQDFLRTNSERYYSISISIVMKGLELEFTSSLSFLRSIDLSSNNLTTLLALKNLNLSNNHLQGSIPLQIGQMQSIESLDLRMNELSGIIPMSLANLNFLTTLNLSYNNLSGPIPTGNQLQTLDDPSIYIGNNYLCGTPLSKRCNNNEILGVYEMHDIDDRDRVLSYFLRVGLRQQKSLIENIYTVISIRRLKENKTKGKGPKP
ncbi:LRR receptor-like serine/threonine-protein kinase GSO1 [Rhynchospora pubera]|uniref:LRR receptor-like serine/threonine-protein kinase GSO1 n=1 Tax=Rhynchospora pubera TaxID=906938 RepID=A0AAV8EUG2_9POAL|nr:LRR receptor-like serine/threonine-protein kinase GSO1 [Rhynchospora pubera]